jgi:hypothetical protein
MDTLRGFDGFAGIRQVRLKGHKSELAGVQAEAPLANSARS